MNEPALLLGDNMSVVLNTTIPSSQLKKKHLSCSYIRIRECKAARIVRFAHISSEENVADILTKPLPNEQFLYLTKKHLFRTPPGWKLEDQSVVEGDNNQTAPNQS